MAGAGRGLTVVIGSAGAGKSVLLSSWAAARPAGTTSWLSCDEADANPVRFWSGFIEAAKAARPEFGNDAADLLALDAAVSADVTASLANDVARLPAGSAIIVDDFQNAASAVAQSMTDLLERWPHTAVQLVLSARSDPPLRLHRLRMSQDLCELRDRDLCFTQAESSELLANFGVAIAPGDLARLQQRSEGWVAAVQMAALSLRGASNPELVSRAVDIPSHKIADYFIAEVLERQPSEVTRFMLDTSVLEELTALRCSAVTGRQDAAALLHRIDSANLFLVPLDDERRSFRYHHLVRQVLHAELRARDRVREQVLQLRAAESFESTGDCRRAARCFFAAGRGDRALALLQDRVVADFLRDPALPAPLNLGTADPAMLASAPDQLLALAVDLLLSGDAARGGEYLDLLERAGPVIAPDSKLAARFAAARSVQHWLIGQAEDSVREGLAARGIRERMQLTDDWTAGLPLVLLRAYTVLEDYPAVENEAAVALATPELPELAKLVPVRGARALAWFEAGRLTQAAAAAAAADRDARRLGFDQHFFAVDYLRAQVGLALERRDLAVAEQLAEQALSISERGRPSFEFLALLDRAAIWAAIGQVSHALETVETARRVLPAAGQAMLARADELEGVLRLWLGDRQSAAELARRLPAGRSDLLLARAALAGGNSAAAQEHLCAVPADGLTPRRALARQILLAATAIERGDPVAASLVADAVDAARRQGFCHTVVATAPQVTSYLVEHSARVRLDPFMEKLTGAALAVRAADPVVSPSQGGLIEPLTAAELRVLKLIPTSTSLEMAATLFISRNTVKTHLRSIYHKLLVTSRAEAVERAVDLHLLLAKALRRARRLPPAPAFGFGGRWAWGRQAMPGQLLTDWAGQDRRAAALSRSPPRGRIPRARTAACHLRAGSASTGLSQCR